MTASLANTDTRT